MLNFLNKAKNFILEILFPAICLNCRQDLQLSKNFICADCLQKISINNSLFCPICRKRLPEQKNLCHHADTPIFLLAAAGNYDDPILKNIIHRFKYKKVPGLTPFFGEILINYIGNMQLEIRNFIVVPIPLHFWRKKSRGFNQAELLGKYAAKKLQLDFSDCLKRIKNNPPQAKLNANQREKNISGCFQIRKNSAQTIAGKNILLIDDVCTSGATLSEAVKILRQNRCRKIIALTLAKT